jgi:hypothetical protein
MMDNWMDPTIPFSMGHFWKMTTFGEVVDFSHQSFPPVAVTDPRHVPPKEGDRGLLQNAVLAAVDQQFHPNWDSFDRVIIYFAQRTDMYGGEQGTRLPNGKLAGITVFDIDSPFDAVCQEVGHALGIDHEIDPAGIEYACPYSVMSAAGNDLSFDRAPDARLPGNTPAPHPQKRAGPYIPAAHLYINQNRPVNPHGAFNNEFSVNYLSVTYAQTPATLSLVARDAAIAAWPNRKPVLAVIPPVVPAGDTYFLELLRPDGMYDHGIVNPAVTILSGNFFAGGGPVPDVSKIRIKYRGRIDLKDPADDLDYHSIDGRFVVRVDSYAADYASVNITVGGDSVLQADAPDAKPKAMLKRLSIAGIDYSVPLPELTDWLNNPEFTEYPALSEALLKLLDGKALRRSVYLDVIAYNYVNTPGVASPRKLADVKFDVLEAAVLAGSNSRYDEAVSDLQQLLIP